MRVEITGLGTSKSEIVTGSLRILEITILERRKSSTPVVEVRYAFVGKLKLTRIITTLTLPSVGKDGGAPP